MTIRQDQQIKSRVVCSGYQTFIAMEESYAGAVQPGRKGRLVPALFPYETSFVGVARHHIRLESEARSPPHHRAISIHAGTTQTTPGQRTHRSAQIDHVHHCCAPNQ